MIEALQPRLAADAERAGVHRMIGIALELDDAAVAVFGDDAAARRAFAAHGGELRGDAGDDVLRRDDIGDELLGRLSAAAAAAAAPVVATILKN